MGTSQRCSLMVQSGENWKVELTWYLKHLGSLWRELRLCMYVCLCVCVSLLSLSLVHMQTLSGHAPDSFLPMCLHTLPLISLCSRMAGNPYLCFGGEGEEREHESTCLLVPSHHLSSLKFTPFLLPLFASSSHSFQSSLISCWGRP